jgi:hypothetical protein
VGRNADGRFEVFALGQTPTGPELSHIWQDAGSPTGWSDWASLGSAPGQFMSALDVGQNADGRLEVFTRVGLMSSGVSWHIWQDPASATGWSGWADLGAPPGVSLEAPTVGENADGRLEVFALEIDGALWHAWQDPASPTGWSGWDSLGGAPASAAGVGRNADGRLETFVEGQTPAGYHELWHRWQVSLGGGWSVV